MEAPGDSQDGVVYTQTATATGGGRVNAVQHGDQYNYIYRGTPPYRVECFPITSPASVPAELARVPSRLLSARHQVVPFLPRPELALLESWRDDVSPGLSVRLVHAEGGSGKTRLAVEFAARSAEAGWAVVLARHRSEVASAGGGDESLTVRAPGLVMVVDYAERWPLEDLITLVRQHRDAARDRLRILLLSRTAGAWWQGLAHQFAKLDILDVQALELKPLTDAPGVRADMYIVARDRFATFFALGDPARIGVPNRLDDPVFALTLTVHMRALVDVDAASRGQTPPTNSGQASLSSYLLDREHDHWRSSHDHGRGPVRTTEQSMGRAVYVATLTRPLASADAAAALTRAGVADNAAASGQLIEDHSRCYPPTESGLVLEPLYPDRLGEDYLALTLPGHEEEFGYHATDPWTIAAPARLLAAVDQGSGPAPYTRPALSVMIEAAHRWPHLAAWHLGPLLRQHPALALAAGSAALTRLADLTTIDDVVLEAIEPYLPDHAHVDLDLGAAAISARLTERRLASTTDPATRATLHAKLSERYVNAGLYQQALASIQQATSLFSELAGANPAAYLPSLAAGLGNLSGRLMEVGRWEEALAPAQEAVNLYRELAKSNPAAHLPDLAEALTVLGARLSDLHRKEEAVPPAQESVDIHRELVKADPAAHLYDLAGALHNLGIHLAEAGRREEALAPARAAVDLYSDMAKANPAAYLPNFATSLNNLGPRLWDAGRREEALASIQESVAIRRELAKANPAAHLSALHLSLSYLSAALSEAGRREEALAPAQESVAIRRELAKVNPAAHLPFLAMSLSNLGILFLEEGRREEALAPTQEAADHFRELAKANPAAHLANLAMALSNLSVCLAQVGRREEAHALAQESVATRRARAKAPYSSDSLLASAQQAVQNSRTQAKADSSESWKSRFWRRLTGPQP